MTKHSSDVVSLRSKALWGDIITISKYLPQWKVPKWSLNIFVSSTFTDTIRERDELMGPILYEFRNFARKYFIELVFVDM